MERPRVLLAVAHDTATYAGALERAGFDVLFDTGPDTGPDTDEALPSVVPDLAVLDADGDSETVERIHAQLHGTRTVPTILLLGEDLDAVAHLNTASDEFALKPVPAETLIYRLQALMIRGGRPDVSPVGGATGWDDPATSELAGEAKVVTVFAPKGGVGKTTVAVNLAVALRQQTRSRVLLIDADAGVGNVTAVIEVPARRGLVDLADTPPEYWTSDMFEHLVATHEASGLRVVTWGWEPGDAELVTSDMLIATTRWGRQTHAFVVIDTHPGYDDRAMAMLTVASEILLVVTPEVAPLRNSAQFIELAREVGLASQIRVIANRANHGIAVKDMASALGLPVMATVVSAGPRAVTAANEGRPLVIRFPNERIASDIHNIARMVARNEEAPQPDARRRWWQVGALQRAQA